MFLRVYIRDRGDISLQYKVLDALKDEEKELYAQDLIWVVRNSKDLSVLNKAIDIAGRWKLKELKPELVEISNKHYRKSVREKAKKVSSEL